MVTVEVAPWEIEASDCVAWVDFDKVVESMVGPAVAGEICSIGEWVLKYDGMAGTSQFNSLFARLQVRLDSLQNHYKEKVLPGLISTLAVKSMV